MRVIPPITINDTNLISSTIAEPTASVDPSTWVSGSAYAIGDKVYVASTHKIYQALGDQVAASASSLVSPATDVTLAIPKWVEIGVTNKWAMFDTLRSSGTIAPTGSFTVVIELPAV